MTTTTLSAPAFAAPHESLFGRMLRLWIAHHQRLAEHRLSSF